MPFDVRGRDRVVRITEVDYALVKARGDGNCLFHAAGHGLAVAGLGHAGRDDHALLRTEVCDYIAANAKATNPLGLKLREGMGIARNVEGAVTAEQEAAIDRRIEFLRRAGSWGDEACLTAIERLYTVQVEIYDDQGRGTVLGVPYYAASHAQVARLRLCVRMVGHTPYHYDLYLPDAGYDAERDGGNRVLLPARKGGLIPQSADEPWAYHLDPKGLRLFTPAIGHRQFTFSRGVVEAKGKKAKSKPRPVEVALGDQVNVVEGPPAPVRAVRIVNADDKGELSSASWSDESELDALVPVREPLILPLARIEGLCTNLLDLERSSLCIETAGGDERQPALLFVRIYRRGHGSRAAKAEGLLAEIVLELATLKPKQEELSSPARIRYTFALADVLRKQEAVLTWEASPFQLVASSDPDYAPTRSAWTHAHVPSEQDVHLAEALAKAAVIPMTDTPSKAALGGTATVQALANTSIGIEAANGREDFEMPADAKARLQRIVAAANLAFDVNAHNYLLEVQAGRYYLSTSWASMASIELHEDGHYYLHALYWYGSNRHAYIFPADDLAHPDRRGVVAAPYNTAIRSLELLGNAISNVNTLLINALQRQRFNALKAKNTYPYSFRRSQEQAADYALIELFEQRYGVVVQRTQDIRGNQGICALLLQHGINAEAFTVSALNPAVSVTPYLGNVEQLEVLATKTRASLTEARARLTQKGLALDHVEVDGVTDFDTGSGKRLASNITWKVHVFGAPLRLDHAVTAGISSCAGGVTVTSEEVPAHVWLWHLDADLSIPLLADMERLWPKGKDVPPMRTVALVYPMLWELNKYRPDNLYPATVAAKCATLFYLRGRHFYGEKVVTSAGCNVFGVDLQQAERRVDWVFTYDLDNRTELLTKWHALLEASEDAPEVLAHLQDDLYGTYRYDGAAPDSTKALVAYIGRLRDEVDDVKRHKRRTTGKSCRVPSISAATIDALGKLSAPVLGCDCLLACEVGDAELSNRLESSKRWLPGSFEVVSK